MGRRWINAAAVLVLGAACGFAQPVYGATTCRMRFSLEGWSAFYESASGHATITCDNGQSARANIRAKGGGLTVGKMKIVNGEGRFSQVADISEVFGGYASAQAHAGMVESSTAQVVTKGTVSLALSGTGKGVDLGVSFGEFVIERTGAKRSKKSK